MEIKPVIINGKTICEIGNGMTIILGKKEHREIARQVAQEAGIMCTIASPDEKNSDQIKDELLAEQEKNKKLQDELEKGKGSKKPAETPVKEAKTADDEPVNEDEAVVEGEVPIDDEVVDPVREDEPKLETIGQAYFRVFKASPGGRNKATVISLLKEKGEVGPFKE